MSSTTSSSASAAAATTATARSEEPPYPGPRPFSSEESGHFFGRVNEVAELASLVRSHAVVLLYADSGAGKSSLIEAGLRQRMEGRLGAVVLTGRVKGPDPGAAGSGNVYVENLLRSLGVEPVTDETEGTLAQGLDRAPWGDGPLRVVVIDQFEEVFTLFPERWSERRTFFEQIQAAVDGDPRLRFLFAMRSDYLTRLQPYTSAFTDDLRTRYALERLRHKDAVDAVIRPAQGTSRTFTVAAAELLVDELLAIPSEVPGAPAVPGEFVEPGELQIVCRDIWQRVPAGEIGPDQIRTLARLDEVHGRFYDRAVAETVGATRVRESKLRRWFGESLITPAGTRGFLFKDKTHTAGLPNAVVDVLERQQVVRVERRANSQWYELTHDRMVAAVVESNRRWFSRRRKRLRRRSAAIVAAVVAVLFVVVPLAVRSPPPPSLTSLGSVEDRVHRAGTVERIPFRASAGTDASIILDLEDFASKRWDLRLLDDEGEVLSTQRLINDTTTRIGALLRSDGTYLLEISGGDDAPYHLTGQEARRAPVRPIQGDSFDGSLEESDGLGRHPISVPPPELRVITVESDRPHFVTVLDPDENFLGGPDYEEPLLSSTVLTAGEYLLEVSMEEPGRYSMRVEAPNVEPLVEGQTREATIALLGELDVYSFEAPGRVALFRMTSAGQPDLTVLTPDGIATEIMPLDGGRDEISGFVAFAAEVPGVHFLVAGLRSDDPFGEPGASRGSYRLSYVSAELPR